MIQEQEKFQLSALNPYLICSVCNGYFRFAHTLSECGHTFCLICITSKTHCPRCPNTQITKTTLRKDPYLQSIVDMFFPEFQKEDQIILDRLQKLFGENIDFNDLQSLLVEKSYEFKKNKKKKKFEQKQGLAHLVEVTFNGTVSYEQFKDNIYDEQKFKLYLNQIKKQQKEACKIEQTKQSVLIAGKRESDNQIAKLNCRVTYHHNEQLGLIKRLRRLVLKSVKKQDNIEKLIDVNRATIDNVQKNIFRSNCSTMVRNQMTTRMKIDFLQEQVIQQLHMKYYLNYESIIIYLTIMRDLQSELRALYIKLGFFYFFLLFDLIWSSFIEPTTMTQISSDTNDNQTQILWMCALHIIITGIIFVLFCTLMWQTQPLKLGMVKLLVRDFLYVFLVSGMMLILVVIERVAIFVTNTATKSIIANVIKENWNSFFYQLFYYIRYLLRPIYLFVMLHGSMKIAKPYYHMRNPELFLN